MELPYCQDIGGEESSPDDFCSIDFYVPSYMEQEIISRTTNSEGKIEERILTKRVSEPKKKELSEYKKSSTYKNANTGEIESSETIYRPLTPQIYYSFGFVYGCRWMDDFTVHFLDLSEVEKGIIRRDARFGYVQIPSDISLKEAIDMRNFNSCRGSVADQIQVHVIQTFDLITGKQIIESYK